MKEEAPKCNSCGKSMILVDAIGRHKQIGEFKKQENSEYSIWHQIGVEEMGLYQCPECKDVKIS